MLCGKRKRRLVAQPHALTNGGSAIQGNDMSLKHDLLDHDRPDVSITEAVVAGTPTGSVKMAPIRHLRDLRTTQGI
jgi:hypothetical protein